MSLVQRPVGFGDRVFVLRGALAALAFVVSLAAAAVWLIGARNPYTPAGYVGYLTKGAVFGKARSTAFSAVLRPRADRGSSTSPTSASRRTRTTRTSRATMPC